jgi:hypothetical protein
MTLRRVKRASRATHAPVMLTLTLTSLGRRRDTCQEGRAQTLVALGPLSDRLPPFRACCSCGLNRRVDMDGTVAGVRLTATVRVLLARCVTPRPGCPRSGRRTRTRWLRFAAAFRPRSFRVSSTRPNSACQDRRQWLTEESRSLNPQKTAHINAYGVTLIFRGVGRCH